MASSSGTWEEPPLVTTEAKMVVATGRDNCQQLKDMLSKDDTSSMVVVMASSNQASTPNPRSPPPPVMDPGLLAVACSGSWQKLQSFLNGDPHPPSSNGANGSSALQQPSRDQEALVRESFLDGVTVAGDTFLHVMATNSVEEDLVEDGPGLICSKAVQRLFVRNNNGDTPLHCAARAEKSQMVTFLVDLARGNDANTVKALLEKQNNRRWTVLHEAVRAGNNHIVKLLMEADPELASFPQDGTSPLYLAILLENKIIAKTLYEKSKGILSYSGPNGQNALQELEQKQIQLSQQ
jgi:ankyrin repeat protein